MLRGRDSIWECLTGPLLENYISERLKAGGIGSLHFGRRGGQMEREAGASAGLARDLDLPLVRVDYSLDEA